MSKDSQERPTYHYEATIIEAVHITEYLASIPWIGDLAFEIVHEIGMRIDFQIEDGYEHEVPSVIRRAQSLIQERLGKKWTTQTALRYTGALKDAIKHKAP